MPFLTTPPVYRFPWYVRLFFWSQKRRYGSVLESARLWARTPKVFVALALLYGALDRRTSPIEPLLRSLITVRVSQINGCHFCVDLNSFIVLRRGLDPDKLAALSEFETSPLFSEREKAALLYAEAVTDSNRRAATLFLWHLTWFITKKMNREFLGYDHNYFSMRIYTVCSGHNFTIDWHMEMIC